jgi:catechol 2,3-dioxygenase-like lactoylglutathione lyase family enzyme
VHAPPEVDGGAPFGDPMRLNQVTLPATDVAVSVAFYRRLGFTQIVDAPHYARFQAAAGDATFSVERMDGPMGAARAIVYFECDDLDRRVAALEAKGVEFIHGPRDEPWLWREARLRDPAGNVICLYYAGDNRLNPPWRVKA